MLCNGVQCTSIRCKTCTWFNFIIHKLANVQANLFPHRLLPNFIRGVHLSSMQLKVETTRSSTYLRYVGKRSLSYPYFFSSPVSTSYEFRGHCQWYYHQMLLISHCNLNFLCAVEYQQHRHFLKISTITTFHRHPRRDMSFSPLVAVGTQVFQTNITEMSII